MEVPVTSLIATPCPMLKLFDARYVPTPSQMIIGIRTSAMSTGATRKVNQGNAVPSILKRTKKTNQKIAVGPMAALRAKAIKVQYADFFPSQTVRIICLMPNV